MVKGFLAGAIGGLIGTWAMSEAQRAWTRAAGDEVPASAGGKHAARDWQERDEHQNSNELAAQAVARYLVDRRFTYDELRIAAPVLHYAFGTAVGAMYGAYAERRHRKGSGAWLGTTLWFAADEVAMPVLGLSEPTTRRPLEMHLQSLTAHLVYGAVTEVIRRLVHAQLDANAAERRPKEDSMPIRRSHTAALGLTAAALGTAIAVRALRRKVPYDFNGKSVVITGGSRGLGLVLARQLAGMGAHLTLMAREENELRRAVDNIHEREPHADVLTVPGDVRERADAERAIAKSIERYGRVDVVINNAGIIQVGPLDHMKLSDYDDALKTHFWGPLFMVLAALPHMRNQGAGRIVNISSIGGRIAVPHMVPYSASKFALTGLSDGLRAELAHENIIVTTVCPGLMRTGSPVNADFKGKHGQEYSWFAVSSSLPGMTIGAERAARQIVNACRNGDAELVITVQAKLAILARALVPELFEEAMSLINRLLPPPGGRDGDTAQPGRSTGSEWAGSKLLAPMYAAAQANNEL
jgi:NAD(P)-dependent dehydrogenase (short-subunit alcohol dehydrogenase family)